MPVLLAGGCGSRLDPADVVGAGSVTGGAMTVQDQTPTTAGVATVGGTSTSSGAAPPGSTAPVAGSGPQTGARGPAAPGAEPTDPTGDAPRGACDGFESSTGIDDDSITIGNAADVSGPVPGIFESSQDAVRAYVAYFNATSDICGRTLDLELYDSRTDGAAEQQAYVAACDEVFAMVGSMSAFDSSGAADADECGLPDIRTTSITTERVDCRSCFGALSTSLGEFQNAVPDFVLDNYPEAADRAAMLYINIGAAPVNARTQVEIFTQRGMSYDYVQGVEISEFNYTPYAQQLKDRDIGVLQFIGSESTFVRLAQAMRQIDYFPDLYLLDPTAYKPEYVESGGEAVEGTVVFLSTVPFEETSRSPEMQLYTTWLQQVKPGADPTFFGVYAWSAARLFVEQASALGGDLSRAALVGAVAKVDQWTANGIHAPQRVGPERVGECNRFVQLRDGVWVPVGGRRYTCTGTTTLD